MERRAIAMLDAHSRGRLRLGQCARDIEIVIRDLIADALERESETISIDIYSRDRSSSLDVDGVRVRCSDDGEDALRVGARARALAHVALETRARWRSRSSAETFVTTFKARKPGEFGRGDGHGRGRGQGDDDDDGVEAATARDAASNRTRVGADVECVGLYYNNRLALTRMRERVKSGRCQRELRAVVFHAALMNPTLTISLSLDGESIERARGDRATVLDGLRLAFGDDVATSLRVVDYVSGGVEIRGYVSSTNRRLGSNELQFIYVNGDVIRGDGNALRRALIRHEFDAFLGDGARKGHGKGYAGFLISISCPLETYAMTYEDAETLIEFVDWRSMLEHVRRAVCDDDCWPVRVDVSPAGVETSVPPPAHAKTPAPAIGANERAMARGTTGGKRELCACCADGAFARSTLRRLSGEGARREPTTAAAAFEAMSNPAFTATSEPPILTVDSLASSSPMKPPASMDASDLRRAKVISQVGDKFIVTVLLSDVVVVFDQHAADERVSLEELWARVLGPDAEVPTQSTAVPWPTPLSAFEYQALESNAALVRRWGWEWTDAKSENDHEVNLTRVPTVRGTALGGDALREYLAQIVATSTQSSQPPRPLHRLLASKACRGAIMFGDKLSNKECQAIIGALRLTQLPFACAHGRPTMAPLCRAPRSMAPTAAVASGMPNIRAWIRAKRAMRAA